MFKDVEQPAVCPGRHRDTHHEEGTEARRVRVRSHRHLEAQESPIDLVPDSIYTHSVSDPIAYASSPARHGQCGVVDTLTIPEALLTYSASP